MQNHILWDRMSLKLDQTWTILSVDRWLTKVFWENTKYIWQRIFEVFTCNENTEIHAIIEEWQWTIRNVVSNTLTAWKDQKYDITITKHTDDTLFAIVDNHSQILTSAKNAEDKLKIEYDKLFSNFEKAQKISSLWNWVWDIKNWDLTWSKQIYKIFWRDSNIKPDYNSFLEWVHPDDRKKVNNAIKNAKNWEAYSIDHRIILPSWEIRIVHEDGEVEFDWEWNPINMIWIVLDITDAVNNEQKLERMLEFHKTMRDIEQRALSDKWLNESLLEALKRILSIPWLATQWKWSIFLKDKNDDVLNLVAEQWFHKELLEKCQKVPFWYCLCGKSAEQRKIIFENRISKNHQTTFPEMNEHWHYCVPIDDETWLLWLLNIYVDEGHISSKTEYKFFLDIANTLKLLIKGKKEKEALFKAATIDSLTWLYNRDSFKLQTESAINNSKRENKKRALLFIDLDEFKHVNEDHWLKVWDQYLQEIARRMWFFFNHEWSDMIWRQSSDEFLASFEVKDEAHAWRIAWKLMTCLKEPIMIWDIEIRPKASIWISIFGEKKDDNFDELLVRSDWAMNKAKKMWKGNFAFFDKAMHEQLLRKRETTEKMKVAIEKKQFSLHYQPQIDLKTWKIIWAESLLRWNIEEEDWFIRTVSPAEFIPIAEESWQIIEIWYWVFEEACEKLKWFQNNYYPEFKIWINLSPLQMKDDKLIEKIIEITKRIWVNPKYIDIEITESVVENDSDHYNEERMNKKLSQLKEYWFSLSVDDYGTWGSSMSRARKLKRIIDKLKIDRSFIWDLDNNQESRDLTEIILATAKILNLLVIAEWVENQEQLNILSELWCDQIQWYHYSKPLPLEEFKHAIFANKLVQNNWDKKGTWKKMLRLMWENKTPLLDSNKRPLYWPPLKPSSAGSGLPSAGSGLWPEPNIQTFEKVWHKFVKHAFKIN